MNSLYFNVKNGYPNISAIQLDRVRGLKLPNVGLLRSTSLMFPLTPKKLPLEEVK